MLWGTSLTPYRTFSLCGNRLPALRRRSVRLVDALASRAGLEIRDNWDLFRPQKIAERIRISVEPEPMLTVNLWPADTVRQARHFYEMVDRTAFLGLDDWKVGPNLHFSYMNQHQVWAETRWANSTYFDYFEDGQVYGQMDQARLVPLAEQWESQGLITQDDLDNIEYQFKSTKRKTLNVIPGFSVSRVWNLNAVIGMEQRGELEASVVDALATPLSTWGEAL